MPTVTFLPSGRSIEVKPGTTLFRAARECGLPVAASCDEEFICGKCNMTVLEGTGLSRQTEAERKMLVREGRPVGDRISCKTSVYGDCVVSASYW